MEISLRSLRNAALLSLVLGLSAFTFAQYAGQSDKTATPSKSSTSQEKKDTSSTAQSSEQSSGQLSSADKRFVMDAAHGGLAEVQLGQLAASKGSSEEVKQFGQKMVDDHSKANDQLKSLAQQKGITLPTDLKPADEQFKAKLEKASGAEFDKMYMHHMMTDHKKDVAEFKKAAESAKDPDIKNFASETLPTLEQHLDTVHQDMAKLGIGSKSQKKSESAQQ